MHENLSDGSQSSRVCHGDSRDEPREGDAAMGWTGSTCCQLVSFVGRLYQVLSDFSTLNIKNAYGNYRTMNKKYDKVDELI